jgi:hypothetical protein
MILRQGVYPSGRFGRRDIMSAKVCVRLRLMISDQPLMILGNII